MPLPEVSNDEIRDLIVKGWTPPAAQLEPFRYLLRPFYDVMGYSALVDAPFNDHAVKTIAALLATFDAFGIPIPEEPEDDWIVQLRAFVADHEGFTTRDAVEAIGGFDCDYHPVAMKLQEWGLSSHEVGTLAKGDINTVWTTRKAA